MIVAFSTSSPLASVALLELNGSIIGSRSAESNQNASRVCLQLLDELLSESGLTLQDVDAFAADIGPGSFTGTRVGVVLAKVMARERDVECYGATSLDLLGKERTVFVPSKRGEYIIRAPGQEPDRFRGELSPDWIGYANGVDRPIYPLASGFGPLLSDLEPITAEALNPYYFNEPSISTPNKPYKKLEGPVD